MQQSKSIRRVEKVFEGWRKQMHLPGGTADGSSACLSAPGFSLPPEQEAFF